MIGGGIVATLITAVVVIKKCLKSPGDTIIAAARKYVGIRETGDNGGWDNAAFQDKMKAVGWYVGGQWCAFFVMMIMQEISKGKAKEFFKKTLHCNTQQMWKNLQTPSPYHEVSQTPSKGALIIYQGVSNPNQGHVEIYVDKAKDGGFNIISGNSGFATGGGQGVVEKHRPASGLGSGYKILGYIKIKKLK